MRARCGGAALDGQTTKKKKGLTRLGETAASQTVNIPYMCLGDLV
jgi:hypothetical protein